MASFIIGSFFLFVMQNQEHMQAETDYTVQPEFSGTSHATAATMSQTQNMRKQKRTTSSYKFKKVDFVQPDSQWLGSIPNPPQEEMSPLQYFKAFWDNELFELIATQTNLYAHQKDGVIFQTNKCEIEQFIGILLQMGIVKMPSFHMYWSNECRYPPVADTMSRNKFFQLLTYFHIANNQEMPAPESPNYDKVFKVRPLLTSLKTNLQSIPPEEYHSVDEQIIPFKGRSSLKQYCKNKPHKWGYKCFTRAGATGIMYDFEIYVGKNTCADRGLGFSGDIVITLTDNLPEKQNFKVFADNWFSSIPLSIALNNKGILFVGTVRNDRMGRCPLTAETELKKCGRGSCDWRVETNSNTALVRWYDRKVINLVSSYSAVEPMGECRRYSASDKRFISIPRPEVVALYNKHMGGVDLVDMLIELYRINFRSKKWYMRIVYWCLAVGVVNGWLLYRRHMLQRKEKPKLTLLQFQSHIAAGLTMAGKDILSQRKRGRPNGQTTEELSSPKTIKRKVSVIPIQDIRLDGINHLPNMVEKKGRCKVCIKSTTQIECMKCRVKLCLTAKKNCFHAFHTK